MHAVMSLVAASAVSISAGWTRLPAGGYEYIIQIEPEAVASLVAGEEFISEVPPDAREVRSYRVRVGRDKLPRESGALTIPLGPPPADTTLPLGPPPDTSLTQPNLGAPPETDIAALPPRADSRHVGIYADGQQGADEAARLAGHAANKVGEASAATGPSALPPGAGGNEQEPSKALWAPLFGSLLALFASVGGNVFLGWTAVNLRGRYKALLAHQQLA